MKGRSIPALLYSLILLAALVPQASAILVVDGITGEAVTGGVTDQPVDLRIYVVSFPGLIVYSPKNATYLNQSVILNYLVYSAYSAWYVLDGGSAVDMPNIPYSMHFDAGQGSHLLQAYANNSAGQVSESVRFTVNSTLFTILYRGKFRTAYSGNSTNFHEYSFEELQNLSGIKLENVNYGKIEFDEIVNVTDDKDHNNDSRVDVEGNVNISFNRIEVSIDELPNFNSSATLWLYGLNFTNPRILRNGEVCSSDICTKEDYSSGTLRFHVTGFSNYSAGETPLETQLVYVGGGGGGGATIIRNYTQIIECVNKSEDRETGNTACGSCESPYMPRGMECCLDANRNARCDIDEAEEEKPSPQTSIATETGAGNAGAKLGALNLILIILVVILLAALAMIVLMWHILPAVGRNNHAPQRKGKLTRLGEAEGLRVYSTNGNKIGAVREVYLEGCKVYGWLVELEPNIARNIGKKTVIVRQSSVRSISETMILNEKASDYLEKFD